MKEIQLLFGSFNRHKHREVEAILAPTRVICAADIAGLSDPEETGATLEDNAILKARHYHEKTGMPCFADDTGLHVQALGGAPGVKSARFAGPNATDGDNRFRLLSMLSRPSPAKFRTVVAFFDGQVLHTFEGVLEGEVVLEERGTGGFGYDPIFIPEGHHRTLAELAPEEKNAISHRKRALARFVAFWHEYRRRFNA